MVETLCGRVGCAEVASGVLLMAPQDTQAWLVGLDFAGASEGVALCSRHADRITVPFGWTLTDDRPPARPKRRRKKKAPPQPSPTEAPDTRASTGSSTEPTRSAAPSAPKASVRSQPEAASAPVDTDASSGPTGTDSGPATPEVEPATRPNKRADRLTQPESSSPASASSSDAAKKLAERVEDPKPDSAPSTSAADPDLADPVADDATMQLPAIKLDHPSSPSEVPLNADATAAAVTESERRLSVVPGEDDPNKTFGFDDEGQGALWAEREAEREPSESTPLLKRAFRVVKDE